MKRLIKRDWLTINSALALLEAEHDGHEPDEYAPDEEHEAWQELSDLIQETREKVHQRIDPSDIT